MEISDLYYVQLLFFLNYNNNILTLFVYYHILSNKKNDRLSRIEERQNRKSRDSSELIDSIDRFVNILKNITKYNFFVKFRIIYLV